MYIREIPVEHRAEIHAIMDRQKTALYMPIADRKTLFYYYYRFIYVARAGEDVQYRMENDLRCPSCIGKVMSYFKNAVNKW
jgi:hypothetical protein